jgi:glycogen(starch) synthase
MVWLMVHLQGAALSVSAALIVGALPPPAGGVATHCRELQRALQATGLTAEIVDPRGRGPDGRDGRPQLLAKLATARLRRDLIHVHTNGHNPGSWTLAALGAGGHLGPSLLTLHSGLAPAFIRANPEWARRISNFYTRVIAVNGDIAAALVAAGVAREHVVVCAAFTPSALSFRLAPAGLAQIRRAHPLLIACMLAPGVEYGAECMLDAFALVHKRRPDAGLVIYGPGTREPRLAAAVDARGLGGSVHHLGELTRERALAVAATADVFVRPTLADGDAISVREALALGRPVVASQVGTRPAGIFGFAAGDAAACAEQIFHAVDNGLPEFTPQMDCLPSLLDLYRRMGAAVTNGTSLATRQ